LLKPAVNPHAMKPLTGSEIFYRFADAHKFYGNILDEVAGDYGSK
jgi:hypothetical protein